MQLNKKRYLSSKHQVDELAQSYNTTKLLAVFISFLILYMLKLHHASPAVIHIDVGLPVEQPLWQCHSGPHRRQCAAQYRRQGWCLMAWMLICRPPECWFMNLRYQLQLNGVIFVLRRFELVQEQGWDPRPLVQTWRRPFRMVCWPPAVA